MTYVACASEADCPSVRPACISIGSTPQGDFKVSGSGAELDRHLERDAVVRLRAARERADERIRITQIAAAERLVGGHHSRVGRRRVTDRHLEARQVAARMIFTASAPTISALLMVLATPAARISSPGQPPDSGVMCGGRASSHTQGRDRHVEMHRLRRCRSAPRTPAAALLMMFGASPIAVQRILRHSDIRTTTDVYSHLAPDYLRAEITQPSSAQNPALKTIGFTSPVLQSERVGGSAILLPSRIRERFSDLLRSGRKDLNLRHSAPKADALPGCATPRFFRFVLREVYTTGAPPRRHISISASRCRRAAGPGNRRRRGAASARACAARRARRASAAARA